MNTHTELTDEQYVDEMCILAGNSRMGLMVIDEFNLQRTLGETVRMSAVIALSNFDLIAG